MQDSCECQEKGGVESIMQISFLVLFFFSLFLSDFGLFGVFFFTYVHKSDNKTWNTVQCLGCVASRTGLVVHRGVPRGTHGMEK